jgi:hypothetical protein
MSYPCSDKAANFAPDPIASPESLLAAGGETAAALRRTLFKRSCSKNPRT